MKDMIQGFITKLKDEIKNIKDYSIKEFLYKYKISLLLCSIIMLLGGLGIYVSLAYFNVTSTHTVIGGVVEPIYDIEIKMFKKDTTSYQSISENPGVEYTLDTSKSSCIKGGTINHNPTTEQTSITTNGEDLCKLYYNRLPSIGDSNASIFIEDLKTSPTGVISGTNHYHYLGKQKLNENIIYSLNSTKSSCTNGATVTFNEKTQKINISSPQKSHCKVYLKYKSEKVWTPKEVILANHQTINTRNSFNNIINQTTTGVIYKSLDSNQYDDFGEVYYFAGNPTDNWFNFGGYYWRIIRINGNGTVRLIYQGTAANDNGIETQIYEGTFNKARNNNAYAGYKYTEGEVHGLSIDSEIKKSLDTWYDTNLKNYSSYIDGSSGFCNDRYPSNDATTSNGVGGINKKNTFYGAFIRLSPGEDWSKSNPSFKCKVAESDLFTSNTSSIGNKNLINPIGLINADELSFAGNNNQENINSYLNVGLNYWTMSPSMLKGNQYNKSLKMMTFSTNGRIIENNVNVNLGIRPVINLKSDIKIIGSGTKTDPYKLK